MNPSPQKGLALRWRDTGPCLNCQKRAPACHDRCPEYQKYKADKEARKALERKNREDYNAINEMKVKQICKSTKRKMRER